MGKSEELEAAHTESVAPTAATIWRDRPEDHDYGAAENYLSLVLPQTTAKRLASQLKSARGSERKAKDLLRASGLAFLPADDRHVMSDLAKIHSGKLLSPVLLVRGRAAAGIALIVADGYHRICAVRHLDEDATVPCRIVDLPRGR